MASSKNIFLSIDTLQRVQNRACEYVVCVAK